MQFSTVTIAALVATTSVFALPNSTPHDKHAEAGVYFCTDEGWGPPCKHAVVPFNQCINLSTLNDKVTSVGPDPGSVCNFFNDFNCQGTQLTGLITPGFNNLAAVYNGVFNDAISSYFCEVS